MADQDKGEPGESEKERVDRELIELLNELRVVLPGVQVLFAFLLTVPFSNGFPRMSSLQRDVYFVSFVCTTIAALLLIAPTTYHRLRFRQGGKEQILMDANRLVIAGTAFLAPAMIAAVFVITDVLFHTAAGAAAAAIMATGLAVVWYWLPLVRRRKDGSRRSRG